MLYFLWALPAKTKLIIAGSIFLLAGIAYVAWLSHRARIAENEAKKAQVEANRQMQKADGLQILINADPLAGEIENDRKVANAQAVNTNAAANDFNFSVNRDSGAFTGNYADSKNRFCRNFPADSRCR